MENFEILNSTQLLEIKGGHNEHTHKDTADEGVV